MATKEKHSLKDITTRDKFCHAMGWNAALTSILDKKEWPVPPQLSKLPKDTQDYALDLALFVIREVAHDMLKYERVQELLRLMGEENKHET